MEVVFERCAGIDVHKRTAVVCRITPGERQPVAETRTFGTTTAELLQLSDWLSAGGCTHVGIESTGVYWRPIHNLLEARVSCCLLLGTLDTSRAGKVGAQGRDALGIHHDVPGQPGFDLHAA